MAQLGNVCASKGKVFAKIDVTEAKERFYMEGPRRDAEQQAVQDLTYIRAAASGESTRLGELRAMKRATKRLQDEARAAMRGGIKTESADRIFARLQFDLNNLYGFIPPTGRRQFFCPRPVGWRRV